MRDLTISEIDSAVCELVRALRGSLSQQVICKDLKLKHNYVSKWEAGQRRIPWTMFCDYMSVCGGDIKRPLHKVFGFSGDAFAYAELIRHTARGRTLEQLAELTRKDRKTVGRWLKSGSEPMVNDVFRILNENGELTVFIANIIDPANVPTVQRAFDDCDFLAIKPHAFKLLAYLQTRDYQDSQPSTLNESSIAQKLGLTSEEVEDGFHNLEQCGMIRHDGQRFEVTEPGYTNTGGHSLKNYLQSAKIKSYYLKNALEILEWQQSMIESGKISHMSKSRFSYIVVATSRSAREKIDQKITAMALELREIIANDTDPAEVVSSINVQLCRLFDPSEPYP